MEIRESIKPLVSPSGIDLALALWTQANLVQEYSDNPDHPNVSGWLRSGAIKMIGDIERQAYEMAKSDAIAILEGKS